MMKNNRTIYFHSKIGFTLIEVLTAMSLMAIALPLFMSAITSANAYGADAKVRLAATHLAHSKLAEVISGGVWKNGPAEGDFQEDFPLIPRLHRYHWALSISKTDKPSLTDVTVRVSWQKLEAKRSLALTTRVYDGDKQ